jgi:hypothetical protein
MRRSGQVDVQASELSVQAPGVARPTARGLEGRSGGILWMIPPFLW